MWYVPGQEPDITLGPRNSENARALLLDGAIQYFAAHGAADVSLRTLATALGTSHRMLLYHFGSKEALLVEVVQAVEAAQREILARLEEDATGPASDSSRDFWRHVSDPALAPFARLFFEVYGQALQRRAWALPLLDGVVEQWIGPAAAALAARDVAPADARAEARLSVAVARGLLLDLLATGERDEVDAAAERFFSQYRARMGPSGPGLSGD